MEIIQKTKFFSDEKLLEVSDLLISKNLEAYMELAK